MIIQENRRYNPFKCTGTVLPGARPQAKHSDFDHLNQTTRHFLLWVRTWPAKQKSEKQRGEWDRPKMDSSTRAGRRNNPAWNELGL